MALVENGIVSTESSSGATGRLGRNACRPCLPRHPEDPYLLDISYTPLDLPYARVDVSYACIYDNNMTGDSKNSRRNFKSG